MIYLLSWTGRGFVAFLALIGAVLAGVGIGSLLNHGEVLCFGIGWIGAAIVCYVLGKRWNKDSPIHKFCGLALERWGYIYGGIGLLFIWPGVQALRYGM